MRSSVHFSARRDGVGRRFVRLRFERLEVRTVPAAAAKAFDDQTIAVGFRTGDPRDPVVPHSVIVRPGQTVDEAIAQWRQYPDVAYAEPNYTIHTDILPNDPYNNLLYAQNNTGQNGGTPHDDMDAPDAWNLTTGSYQTVVAVIDTGIDYDHPDLYRNIWINQAEIPPSVRPLLTDMDSDGLITFNDLNNPVNIGPGKITDLNGDGVIDAGDILKPISQSGWADGIDEGGNSYVDDLVGWNFVNNNNDPMDMVSQDGGHGTDVAGTIGAIGNNGVGVNGVAWQVELMPVKFLGVGGGNSVAAAEAIRYAAANGARISNNSWGGDTYSQTIDNAIAYARGLGQVFVTAAGNNSANNDVTGSYPANDPQDNIVSVAASDQNDRLASFSNYGRNSVDLAAAGVNIYSSYPGNQYIYASGTSTAAPQVTGAFALLLSREPTLTYSQAISRMLKNVDPVQALSQLVASGGRLDVYRALTAGMASVGSFTIDDGTSQRSMVRSVTVTFNGPLTFAGLQSDAFQLTRTGLGATGNVTLAADLSGSTATQTVARLTFSGALTEGANSLIDGNYTLTIFGAQVQGGLQGGDNETTLFRLFGDVNGDKAVNGLDLTAFRNAFGTVSTDVAYAPFLDFNGDGAINGTDLTEFRNRFGVILP